MYDELDGMVLNCYNATSMDIGAEATLFRSVPSSLKQAADTNYYTLDVRYMPALYVASSRMYHTLTCLANAICLHDIYDAQCVKCKGKKADGSELQGAFWLLDSGASRHFTGNRDDFADYQALDYKLYAKTANSKAKIVGVDTVLLCTINCNGEEAIVTLAQVLHMPSANARLISMGEFLTSGYSIRGNKSGLQLYNSVASLWFGPDFEDLRHVTYGIRSIPTIRSNYIASMSKVDYDIMHRRFRHPSKAVLQHAQKHTQHFPEIHFPTEDCICPGCAFGKMSNQAFSENPRCAVKAFELMHSDLKSFPVPSYRKYKYIITFYDDFTSHAWTMPLRSKAAVIMVAKDFLELVRVQYNAQVKGWVSDAGSEYKSDAFDRALLKKGIIINQSAPWTPMQNGRAERLMRTLMDKAEAMQHQACIPQSWWEFAFPHTTHIYNRTPVARLQWRTPHEVLKGELPAIDHLCVFGCGAYVYLPAMARDNKMAPKSELMTYIGVAPGNERNFLFMCSTNTVFTAAHAIFDERDFPRCPKNKHNPLEIPQGAVPPTKVTSRPGNNPNDVDDDSMDHDHGYPKHPAEDDDPKQEAPEAPEDELHQQQTPPPRTPSPVPQPALRTPSPVRNPPPPAPPCPGQAEHRQNMQRPLVNLPNRPQRERRVPVRPGNVYGERQHPIEQLRDIENTSRWQQTVGEASQPP